MASPGMLAIMMIIFQQLAVGVSVEAAAQGVGNSISVNTTGVAVATVGECSTRVEGACRAIAAKASHWHAHIGTGKVGFCAGVRQCLESSVVAEVERIGVAVTVLVVAGELPALVLHAFHGESHGSTLQLVLSAGVSGY
eukprot:GHUV01020902.1.p3 GENE.GHUV01020902.1~~GHUV01020902.1.p3  ORF type:complete len:139 (+),score=25.51 GHUV01020902.1:897-1313(+)